MSERIIFSFAAKAAEAQGQLKTMKATLESSRQEMTEYKEKATRILQVHLNVLHFGYCDPIYKCIYLSDFPFDLLGKKIFFVCGCFLLHLLL